MHRSGEGDYVVSAMVTVDTAERRDEVGVTNRLLPESFDRDSFVDLLTTLTAPGDVPHARSVIDGVVEYVSEDLSAASADATGRAAVLSELADVLDTGPGVFIVRNAVDATVLDGVTTEFETMIRRQRAEGRASGDHFAAPGANDRVWNALEKLALAAPDLFVDYYTCHALRLASLAWLGPGYQVTSQVNVVNPGGQAQQPHCDYHLGFMSAHQAEAFPTRVHAMSRQLTLQGAIAHCDMPSATGPTMLLPHSQKYRRGYLDASHPEVAKVFALHHIQLALRAGDAMFFNPSLIHAAGTNSTTHVRRMANLLQVSSAFGRAMESVDRTAVCRAIYPVLAARMRIGGSTPEQLENVLAASAEGYAFPTNLDRDPPIGGLAPPSQADIVRTALTEQLSDGEFDARLREHDTRRQTS